jgi:alpha-D-xyloside xylohydrolase
MNSSSWDQVSCKPELIASGVWRIRLGTPEAEVPTSFRSQPIQIDALAQLPEISFPAAGFPISFKATRRGILAQLPLSPDEHLFGLGLQLKSLDQTGKKKQLRVNSDPVADTGDSHAPVPFFLSTHGYGVLVDTARYATFWLGSHQSPSDNIEGKAKEGVVGMSTEQLYAARALEKRQVLIEVTSAPGVDIYWFGGPDMRTALQRYNLFSGGGCLPPLSALGFWYRLAGTSTQEDAMRIAREFREREIPCDILGLEPGWQTQAYSCSYLWSSRFPEPDRMVEETKALGYKLNLWEHAFVHPTSPLYPELRNQAGDWAVWGGLVPDFAQPDVRQKFTDYHLRQFVSKGVAGFKLDECDNSDFIRSPWSFPECSRFPSGLDGEQMHSLFGVLYQQAIGNAFRAQNRRECGEVRSSHALAAPYSSVLYSDLYDHRDFTRGVLTAGLSGLLWCPEVRQCESNEDLIRRMQLTMLSPQALVNGWMLRNPPWKQVDRGKNNADSFAPEWEKIEAICRELIRLRMRLVPYLYAAFAAYRRTGLPPFRPLVLDYPGDPKVYPVDDVFLVGPSLLVAPAFVGQRERKVYFPEGVWHCFWTGQRFEGGREETIPAPLERIPLFVRDNSLLPLARPLSHCADDAVFDLDVRIYGTSPAPVFLWEDDGVSFDHEHGAFNEVVLEWKNNAGSVVRKGSYPTHRYRIASWEEVTKS